MQPDRSVYLTVIRFYFQKLISKYEKKKRFFTVCCFKIQKYENIFFFGNYFITTTIIIGVIFSFSLFSFPFFLSFLFPSFTSLSQTPSSALTDRFICEQLVGTDFRRSHRSSPCHSTTSYSFPQPAAMADPRIRQIKIKTGVVKR